MNRAHFGMLAAAAMTATLMAVPASAASAEAAAPVPSAITGFKISTTTEYGLNVSGTLTATGTKVPAGQALTIETAPPKSSKWSALPLYDGDKPLVTQTGGAFSGKYYIRYPRGYYRVRYAGTTVLAGTLSNVRRDPRIFAEVTGFKVSKRKIKKNSKVTFSGVLKHYPDGVKAANYAGKRVYIAAKLKGQTDWYWYARPKTDSKGRFKTSIKISKDGQWEWYYAGNKTHYLNYALKPIVIDVR